MTSGSAPGKLILFGEHAVVYGRTAIAVPISEVKASAEVSPSKGGESGQIAIEAPQISLDAWMHDLTDTDPIFAVIQLTLAELGAVRFPPIKIRVDSSIPVAAGMGSSASTSIAIIRALSAHFHKPLPIERQSEIAFEVEKIHHGTPSGIDNTVVAHGKPIIFSSGNTPQPLKPGREFPLVVGDTGIRSETVLAVARVRERWERDSAKFDSIFDQISTISEAAAEAIQSGRTSDLGPLMNKNQVYLRAIGVSSDALESLINAALEAGASGAKLSGGGLGGNMIASVQEDTAPQVASALREAGAVRHIITVITK